MAQQDSSDCQQSKLIFNIQLILLFQYKNDKYTFAISNEEEFGHELQETGLGDSGLEHNVIAFGFDGKKYPMRPEIYDEELDENLEAFMKDLNSGKVKPYVKSAPVPTSDKGPVKTLVASNFEKVLKDDTKDYLVEFYVSTYWNW